MIISSSDSNNSRKLSDEADDFYMTIENIQKSDSSPKKPDTLLKNESIEKEKQISIDPVSVKASPAIPRIKLRPPLPLIPPKTEFLSVSLPSSATSSPRFSPNLKKKKKKKSRNHGVESTGYSSFKSRQESYIDRSKSCGEGRTSQPPDEFDIVLGQFHGAKHEITKITEIEAEKEGEKLDKPDEDFKCGSLCLYLPGFGKGKPVRPPRKEGPLEKHTHTMISRTVSLERFECGSWSSSAIINEHEEDGDSKNLFFDLPMELIQTNTNDAHMPVTAGFVFDKEQKGVLKNGGGRRGTSSGKSHESGRNIRVSTSSRPTSPATCITPRLRKAREDFNAFLEAQSA